VVARAKGSSLFYGHPGTSLQGIHLEKVTLFISTDPAAPYDLAEHALDFRRARDVTLREVEVVWDQPGLAAWRSALNFEEVKGLMVEGFTGRGGWPRGDAPAIRFKEVSSAVVRRCRAAEGTETFLKIGGSGSRDIRLEGNDLKQAKRPCDLEKDVVSGAVED
jgi:hypothetical protein